MRFLITFILLSFSAISTFAQDGHKLEFEVKNYENDTIIVGNFYANRQLVVDTLIKKSGDKKFVLKGDEKLNPGMYLVLVRPDNAFAQFIVPTDDQEFLIKLDQKNFSDVKFKGSDENETFYKYLDFLSSKKDEAGELNARLEKAKEDGSEDKEASEAFDKLDESVTAEQEKLVDAAPNSVFAKLLKSNFSTDLPEFEGPEEESKMKQYLFFKEHYFDFIDLGDSVNLRMPYLHQRVTYYLDKLTPAHPDSISKSIDYLLGAMEPANETYRFYLSYFYNDIVKKRIVGMDAVVVHMVDNYYSKGKAPWLDEENLAKITDNANRLRNTLIGKTAPNIQLFQEDGTPWELYKDSSDYIVMVFWAPECGHCTKSMPKYLEFNEKFKDKGVKMVSICTKTGSKYKNCWEGIKEKNMEGLLNLGDQYLKSKYKTKFDVRQTPKLYILDKNKEILLKDIPAESLESLMDEVIKMQNTENQKM